MSNQFVVAETIGGWLQNSCFTGTEQECQEYIRENGSNKSLAAYPAEDFEPDYL